MICVDGNVRQCQPIVAGMTVDYEEHVVITGIKSGMQCSMCQIPPEKRENLCKIWPKITHDSTRAQLALQDMVE